MTALAMNTKKVRVGTAAINVYTRGAALTAITWATLAELAPGRVVLGVGPGSPAPLGQQGFDFDHPVSRLREFVGAVRASWAEAMPVSYEGRFSRLAALQPEVRPPSPIPIYLCVTGPRALDCAGEIADGVMLNAFMPTSYTRRARARLDAAAGGLYGGELGQCMVVAMAGSVSEGAARVRPILATYLVYFPNLAAETGLDPEFLTHLRRRAGEGGLEATFSDLTDDLVSEHAIVGPAQACRDRLAVYREAGVQLPVLFPDPLSTTSTIEHLIGA